MESHKTMMGWVEKYFGKELPDTSKELKMAYKNMAKVLHPDSGGDGEKFAEMNAAYKYIYDGMVNGSINFSDVTVNGVPLAELGLGLGPTTNGVPCAQCGGKGYKSFNPTIRIECHRCRGKGSVHREFKCRACDNGKFTLRSGRVVDCRKCNGTGVFKHPRLTETCPNCLGTGAKYVNDVTRELHLVCSECGGTGEKEIYNPVLPKGRLACFSA